eukprot:343220_1
MSASPSHWTKHATPPFKQRVSHYFNVNQTELLILVRCGLQLGSLWLYNILNDNYTRMFDISSLQKVFTKCGYTYTASFDNNKSLLYLFGENGKIAKINVKTKQYEVSKQKY